MCFFKFNYIYLSSYSKDASTHAIWQILIAKQMKS